MRGFHKVFYAFMRTVIKPYFWLTGYHWERYDPKCPNVLVLANHNTNWDFFLYGLVLKKHMYFVASEHIFRKGFTSALIRFLADPIPRKKGAKSDDTVCMILQHLKRGDNVCMMAEGNRSFSGETGFISPRTAQLAKDAGAGLVTVAIHGCYFINPRWGRGKRRGPSWGKVVHEYSAEQLAAMSVEEIYAAITHDLYVNAYDDQRQVMGKYRCKKPAEGLENALFYCPECGSLSHMASQNDRFFCRNCGYGVRFNDYGFFETTDGGKVHYDTVLDWYRAQLRFMHEWAQHTRGSLKGLLYDDGLRLSEVIPEVGARKVAEGRLTLYSDRLELQTNENTYCFPLQSINKISIALTDTLLFTTPEGYYEVKPIHGNFCALKYVMASRLLVDKEYV